MLESQFDTKLIKELKQRFPGCIILKNDANYLQGVPDRIILWNDKWATLETKKTKNASRQPNQRYYVDKMNDMSFSAFIYTENMEVILDGLQQTFES